MKKGGLETDHGPGNTDIDPSRNSGSSDSSSRTSPLSHLKADVEPTPDAPPDPASFLDPAYSSISPDSVPDLAWTRWTAGTRLLLNIELSFSSAEVCPDPSETIVFGYADERKSAVIVCRDLKNLNRRHVLTVSRGFLWRPALMFRRLMTNRKTNTLASNGARSFAQLESGILTFSLENLNIFFSYIGNPIESILNMAQRTITTKDSNNVEKEETVKGSTWGLDKRLPPIVVCIGLAKFNRRTGLPSKHGILIKDSYKRLALLESSLLK
ncbi:hypothetical protein BG015_006268 [Linnemannia schmuckeri]|uniref:Uncharacterized protein n=1 Tax=Linnemannia schmuckeri TaxID=64567 RepID=A0A9P5VBW6_9FUNG|nr:hypothetical protein BG015_006268 [Linnemannia schmuckeri]